jgi:hypothetical protein
LVISRLKTIAMNATISESININENEWRSTISLDRFGGSLIIATLPSGDPLTKYFELGLKSRAVIANP